MKFSIRKNIIKSIVKKEFSQIFRDARMRGIIFGSPIIMLMIFGYAVSTDVTDIALAVLDEDRTAASRSVIDKFTGSRYFKLYSYINSPKELTPLMDSGQTDAYIHIKKGLSRNLKSGKSSEIQVIVDGSDSNRAAVTSAYITQIMNDLFTKEYIKRIKTSIRYRLSSGAADPNAMDVIKIRQAINIKERAFYNPSLSSRNFYLPAVIGLLISLITIMLTSMSIVKEKETGTYEQIIVSPIRPIEYIMGKTIPFAIVGIIDMCIVSLLAIIWFDVPFNGSFIFLLASGSFYILTTLSVGLFISTISNTQQQAMLSFFLFFVPAILFSGFVFPVSSMPEVMQVFAYMNPLLYFITIIRGVFLKGTGFLILWKELLVLAVIGSTLIFLSSKRISRRME